ncbi:hypothetical protein [Lutibacter sp.]|uniref:hypothetical protein n=1 Tax=Lutibacter sp. TaxID=1925666 RepID=UPI001A237854|nr:hypothetical protein [Lutibacter sp.]MBI9041876.1 hypothetical protein [Lutibacter sp.]
MNFSKKNHEHKVVNLKMVSKKIILSIVFVFASLAMVNAENIKNDVINKQIERIVVYDDFCDRVYEFTRDAAYETTGDFIEAIKIAIRAEELCLEESEPQ